MMMMMMMMMMMRMIDDDDDYDDDDDDDNDLREFASANARDTDDDHDFGDHFGGSFESFESFAVGQNRLYTMQSKFPEIV